MSLILGTSLACLLDGLQLEEVWMSSNRITDFDAISSLQHLPGIQVPRPPASSSAAHSRHHHHRHLHHCPNASPKVALFLMERPHTFSSCRCDEQCVYLEHNPIAAEQDYRQRLQVRRPMLLTPPPPASPPLTSTHVASRACPHPTSRHSRSSVCSMSQEAFSSIESTLRP